jgi:hypothetical protein
MGKNQIHQCDRKKLAIGAFISGIISFIGSFTIGVLPLFSSRVVEFHQENLWLYPLYFFLFPFLSILGIVLGIIARKSSKKILAIMGILFGIIGWIFLLFAYFISILYVGLSHMQ